MLKWFLILSLIVLQSQKGEGHMSKPQKSINITSAEIKIKLLSLGYSDAGVIPAEDFTEYDAALTVRATSFPASAKMYDFLRSMAQVPVEAKSIIVATRSYTRYNVPDSLSGRFGKMYLFDGRLKHTKERNASLAFEAFLAENSISIVKGSVPARLSAVRAGLGYFRKNNFFYTEKDGSYVVIDTWLVDTAFDTVTAEFTVVEKPSKKVCSDNCQACMKACPTGALNGPFSMDRGKCVAHFSYTSWAGIPGEALRDGMGKWLYGCDACQDACPFNKGKLRGEEDFPGLKELEKELGLENLLEMDKKTYIANVQPWFFYISEDEHWLWRVNVLRAMANSGNKQYLDAIKRHLSDEDERVREIADWAFRKLNT